MEMLSAVSTDRSSCLGKQRYVYLKHSLFFHSVLNDMFPLGDAASIHPDTAGSGCVREAAGVPVKRSLLCPSPRSCAVGCAGHLGSLGPDLAVRDFRHQ